MWWWALGLLLLVSGRSSGRSPGSQPPKPSPRPSGPPRPSPPPSGEAPPPYEPAPGIEPLWPLPTVARKWRASSFGSLRPGDEAGETMLHKGIDIDAVEGDPVVATEAGRVILVQGWDGPGTRGVLVQTYGGPMLVYGALDPVGLPQVGTVLQRGEPIGRIGVYPGGSTMLHFETYRAGTTIRPAWRYGTPQPETVVNPNSYLDATVET